MTDILLMVFLFSLIKQQNNNNKKKGDFTVGKKNHTKRKLEYVFEQLLYFVN